MRQALASGKRNPNRILPQIIIKDEILGMNLFIRAIVGALANNLSILYYWFTSIKPCKNTII